MAITTVLAAGGTLADELGFDLSKLNPFGGRRSCSDSDRKQRARIAETIERVTTRQERDEFIRSVNMNNPPEPTGQDMAYFYMGQRDCFHKNVGTGDQRYLDQFPGWLDRKVRESRAAEDSPYSNNGDFSEGPVSAMSTAAAGGLPIGLNKNVLISWGVPAAILTGIFLAYNLYQKS